MYMPFKFLIETISRIRDRFTFNPDRYIDDHLSCSESAKLPNAMERDHWTFGAGYVWSFFVL